MRQARLAAFVVTAILLASGCAQQRDRAPSVVTIKRIDTHGHGIDGTELITASGKIAEFWYEARNETRSALEGLKLNTACQCQIGTPIPTRLNAGESARFSFRLRGPTVGTISGKVELWASGFPLPIGTVETSVRVPFTPPQHVNRPESVVLKYVQGESATRDIMIEAIEVRGSENWIQNFAIQPDNVVDVETMTVDESPERDPTLVRRTYRLPLSASTLPVGTTRLTAIPKYRVNPPSKRFDVDVYLEVMGRLSVYPKRLVLSQGDQAGAMAGRFVVVQRGEHRDVKVEPQDASLLTLSLVMDEHGRTRTVSVQPTVAFVPGLRTAVKFVAGDDVEEAEVEITSPSPLTRTP